MPATTGLDDADARARLSELAPSAKFVAMTLEHEGDLTQSELADRTLLPTRTVRSGLGELEDAGLVSSRISLMDARQQVYSLDASIES